MASGNRLKKWLWEQRNNTRLAYMLQLLSRVVAGFIGLAWFRILNGAMGAPAYQVCLIFQKLVTLGGLGDLGMGGVIGIRTGQYLGAKKEPELLQFLATARTIFLLLALIAGAGVFLLSPWLSEWMRFPVAANAGSLVRLTQVGGVMVAGVLLASYISNVNYACGNVTWPVVPAFFLVQVGFLGQWLLARGGEPVWVQYLPHVVVAMAGLWLTRAYVRISHPPLASVLPLKLDWSLAVVLFESSFWIYLCSLGNAIYRSTDAVVINAAFPAGTFTGYEANYRFCEMAVFLAVTASYVSLPKITAWMASPEAADQDRMRREVRRLNQFQTVLGCGAALAYLTGNNLFMRIWWLHDPHPVAPAPLLLQAAFAFNLAITASGDAGIQLAMRVRDKGLRVAGTMIGITGLVNLGLSIYSAMHQSLWGVAMATVLAQSILSIAAGIYTCRHLGEAWSGWAARAWLVPVMGIALASWLRTLVPDSMQGLTLMAGASALILLGISVATGVTWKLLVAEVKTIKQMMVGGR